MGINTGNSGNHHPVLCTLTEVCKTYRRGAQPVLRGVSLQIHAGEIIGIEGENGAGKSTLIELIAGITKPDKGTIRYAKEAKRRIGYVPQELSLYETMTGYENLKFWGIANGLPRNVIATRSDYLLRELMLADKAKEKVKEYSGGMKRRLHLASALMLTPALLLLDEPTVGADAASITQILSLMQRLRDQGTGIVFISHMAQEVGEICDRRLRLQNGEIVP